MNVALPWHHRAGALLGVTRVYPTDIPIIPPIDNIHATMAFVAKHQHAVPRQFQLHHGLAYGNGRYFRFHLGDNNGLQRLGFHILVNITIFGCGEDIAGAAIKFNGLRTVFVMITQTAFVTTQLFIHLFAAGFESGVNFRRMAFGLGVQAGGEVQRGLAGKFMGYTGKENDHFGGTLGVFINNLAQFGLYMGLQRLADVDLFATDLVAHDASLAQMAKALMRYARGPAMQVFPLKLMRGRRGGSAGLRLPLVVFWCWISLHASRVFGGTRGALVNSFVMQRLHGLKACADDRALEPFKR
jgi:hypothetical protein